MGEEALKLSNQAGFGRGIRNSLLALSDLSYAEGDHEAARTLLNEALASARESGDRIHIASASAALGRLAVEGGDRAAAASWFQQSLSVSREVGDRRAIAEGLEDIARLAAAMQRPADALRLAGGAAALREAIGTPSRRAERTRLDTCLAWARTALGEAPAGKVWEQGRAGPLEDAITTGLDLLAAPPPTEPVVPGSGWASQRRGSARGPDALTPREREVAALMARGLSNRRIARELVISEKTAANHVGHILDKLALASRTELAAQWRGGDGAGQPGRD
jgi:DNA-binding CsgD family transcriptional regulator